MPTATISPASSPRWGSSSFNHTGGFKVGTTTDDVQYYGHIPFPALDPTWHITSIKLRLNRTDSYSSRTHRYGVNTSSSWSNRNSLHWSRTQQIASGTGYKTVDLSDGLATIKAYTGTWQVHVTHGAGSYSYMEFTNSPQLVVEYEIATIDVPALTCGEAATLSVMTPPVAGTYVLSYAIGSASGAIDSVPADDTTEVSWTPPLALAGEITDATSAPITLTLTRDDEPILTVDAALAVPVSMVPSISNAVFSIINPVGDAIGVYVQGRSATKATITAASVYGATIASYGLTIAGKVYTGGSEITSDVLALAGTLNAVITATDTRGRTASLTTSGAITVYPYAAPLITDIALARALAGGTETNDGTYIKATLACRLAALNDLNTRELTLRFKPVDGSYGEAIDVTLPDGYDFSVTAIIGDGAIGAGAYEVQATLADRYGEIVEVAALSSAQRWLTLKANGDTEFHGEVRIDKDHRASFLGMLMPLCLLSNPTAEDLVYNSTFRWWLFDWTAVQMNGTFDTLKGGIENARDVGVVIPADGFYRLHFNINLEKASSDSAMGVAILRMPPEWEPPTTVNYMVESDISTRLDRFWRLFTSWSATNTFGAVSGVMWCDEGDKVLPTAYTVNVSKTVNSLLTNFSIQRVG